MNYIPYIPSWRPNLAANFDESSAWDFERNPMMFSMKIDGIRGFFHPDQGLISRTGKPFPNKALRTFAYAHRHELAGFEGEFCSINPEKGRKLRFLETQSTLATIEEPDISNLRFFVFDWVPSLEIARLPFESRIHNANIAYRGLPALIQEKFLCMLPQHYVNSQYEFERLERLYDKTSDEVEGFVLRSASAPYKFGRSTAKSAELMRVVPYQTAEAVIIGAAPLFTNENEPKLNELGYTKRSSHIDGKVPTNALGSFNVRSPYSGKTFAVGTGFTAEQRNAYWPKREEFIGRTIKYKYKGLSPYGIPRHPVFLSFRDDFDNLPSEE